MVNNSKLTKRTKIKHMTQLAEYRENVIRPEHELRTLFIEMTGLCNEHCRHCGSNCGDFKEENPLTTVEIKRFLEQVREDLPIERLRLVVTGGEPLLRKDFFEIMAYAKKLGFGWGMTSNGTLITADVAKKLAECGMKTISVSLDGLKEEHEWFRQTTGSYEKTMAGIKNLVAQGAFYHVQVTTVVTHRNIGMLKEMYREFSKLGVRSWRVINIEPIGRAKEQEELLLNAEEYRQLFNFIAEYRLGDPELEATRKKRLRNLTESGYSYDSWVPGDPMEVTYGCSHYLGVEAEREVRKWYFLCNAGVYTASICYNGDIIACLDIERRPELVQGNIRKDRFSKVWNEGYEIFRTDYRKTGKCADCPDYKFCAGDAYHTWNFDENRPNLCLKGILWK